MLINGAACNSDDLSVINQLRRGWSFGDGVFETISFCSGNSSLWPLHMHRLQVACKQLMLDCPDDSMLLHQSLTLAAQDDCVIRITLIRASGNGYWPDFNLGTGESETQLVVERREMPATREALRLAISSIPLSSQYRLAGIKHISRQEQVLAAAECRQLDGVDDLLLLDSDGFVIEAISSNVIAYFPDSGWVTPPLNHTGVIGVMREWLLQEGLLSIQEMTVSGVERAEALALINSVRGLEEVHSINKKVCQKPELCLPLQQHIRQHIHSFSGILG